MDSRNEKTQIDKLCHSVAVSEIIRNIEVLTSREKDDGQGLITIIALT